MQRGVESAQRLANRGAVVSLPCARYGGGPGHRVPVTMQTTWRQRIDAAFVSVRMSGADAQVQVCGVVRHGKFGPHVENSASGACETGYAETAVAGGRGGPSRDER